MQQRSDPSRREPLAAPIARRGGQLHRSAMTAQPGDERKKFSMHSFGAVFAEVHVDPDLGGDPDAAHRRQSYGVGRLLNRKTAHSQLMGGIVWGVSMALHEQAELDLASGRIANGNLAEYHVPVNADVGAIDIAVLDEDDPHINALGAWESARSALSAWLRRWPMRCITRQGNASATCR
ncbi:molybdopterin cofactor-binding domain-containing protein [Cupriavidus basilensis]